MGDARPAAPPSFAEYALSTGPAGAPRLALSERVYGPYHLNLIEALRRAPGVWPRGPLRVLVLGGGSGAQLPAMVDMAGPGGTVCFTDKDPAQLDEARRVAEAHGLRAHVRFVLLDASLLAAQAGFDVVYSRFLLVHMHDPVGAVANMWRAVRPGGLLISEEHDVNTLRAAPDHFAVDLFRGLLKALSRMQGLHWDEGEAVPAFFHSAGIPLLGTRRHYPSFQGGADKQLTVMSLREGRHRYEQAGLIGAHDMQALIMHLQHATNDPTTKIYVGTLVQTWARKPD